MISRRSLLGGGLGVAAVGATLSPPRSTSVTAGVSWALTTLTISSPVRSSRVTTWANGSVTLSSEKLAHSVPFRNSRTWVPRTSMRTS